MKLLMQILFFLFIRHHMEEREREKGGGTYSFNVRVVGLVEVGHIGVDLDEAVEQLVTAAI